MFTNYSQTYAAAIATYAPLVVLILGRAGINVLESTVILVGSVVISTIGFFWQLKQRYDKGDITALGSKK